MFSHSIKVPRLYKTASKVAKDVSEGKGSIKQLVYESKHPNIKALYALVVHTFQKTDDLETLLKKSKLLVKEPRFDPWLAKILITELLWGKKYISGESKPVKTILAYEQIFKAHLSDVSQDLEDVEQVGKPRYVRINTLKISVNEAVEKFRDEGWVFKRYTEADYLGFLDAVANLGPEEFMVDLHIPYLLIFPPKTQFYKHPAYKNGSIILQDKASCLPVHILNPEPDSSVLDMCAAPGMKTSHCAAILENRGKIYAVEIGRKRFETLNKIIESAGATCVETINRDVLTLTNQECPNIDYILVDPSCSGSGITDRIEIGQQEMEQHHNRLQKLAGFQIKMLRHALTKFPSVRRVVYSTCSVYPEENEDVVRQVLETCRNFKLVPAGKYVEDKWHNFGASDFGDIGRYCLYAKPDIDLTSGFFVAVFERLEEGERNQFLNTKLFMFDKQNKGKRNRRKYEDLEYHEAEENSVKQKENNNKRSKSDPDSVVYENKEMQQESVDEINSDGKKKKKKKKKRTDDQHSEIPEDDKTEELKSKKKKHKKSKDDHETIQEIDEITDTNKKKKKSKKHKMDQTQTNVDEITVTNDGGLQIATKTKKKKQKPNN